MSGSSQITPWGQLGPFSVETAAGGEGEPPALSERRVEAAERLCPASRHIHQKNCQTIVCFFINKL